MGSSLYQLSCAARICSRICVSSVGLHKRCMHRAVCPYGIVTKPGAKSRRMLLKGTGSNL